MKRMDDKDRVAELTHHRIKFGERRDHRIYCILLLIDTQTHRYCIPPTG